MLDTIRQAMKRDKDYPPRVFEMSMLMSVLEGTLYDVLQYEFHQEKNEGTGNQEYIPLRKRKPSVRYNLCRLVVEDSIALLFGDGRFPAVHSEDMEQRKALLQLVQETRLNAVMNEAAIRGSVGSVAILMRVLSGRVFFTVKDTIFLTPKWRPEEPDLLESVTERYKVRGAVLRAMGYTIADDDLIAAHWFQVSWTETEETWFLPAPALDKVPYVPVRDEERTVVHSLGFVPIVWIKNLPGKSATGDDAADGSSTFRCAIETQIEIDYQLSQAGRGLKYSSDPTLIIKEPASDDSSFVKSGDNALVLSEKGDAKLLEIGGTAASAVTEYVRGLREIALETMHGNRASADRLVVAQSGKAMELMHQALIWLADRLRIGYGTGGLLELLRMVSRTQASSKIQLRFRDGPMPELPKPSDITLRWQPWFHMTTQDEVQQATALQALRKSGVISQESAVNVAAETYDIPDATGELARVKGDEADNDRREMALAAAAVQAKASETVPD